MSNDMAIAKSDCGTFSMSFVIFDTTRKEKWNHQSSSGWKMRTAHLIIALPWDHAMPWRAVHQRMWCSNRNLALKEALLLWQQKQEGRSPCRPKWKPRRSIRGRPCCPPASVPLNPERGHRGMAEKPARSLARLVSASLFLCQSPFLSLILIESGSYRESSSFYLWTNPRSLHYLDLRNTLWGIPSVVMFSIFLSEVAISDWAAL